MFCAILVQFIVVYYSFYELYMETFLTPEQVAAQLSVETTTVYTWLRNARLSGVKFGRLWRVRSSDVQAFLQKGWQIDTQKSGIQKPEIRQPLEHSGTSWVDTLPQIDRSDVYAKDALFSREEIYQDDEAESRLYPSKQPLLPHHLPQNPRTKSQKSKGRK